MNPKQRLSQGVSFLVGTPIWMRMRNLAAGVRLMVPRRKDDVLSEIRSRWTNGRQYDRDFGEIEKLYRLAPSEVLDHIDDRTWSDLDMDEVFCQMDHNTTALGRQHLYRTLRSAEPDENVPSGRSRERELLTSDASLRERIQLVLSRLCSDATSTIVHLIFDELPQRPRYYWLIYSSSIAMVLSTAMAFVLSEFLFACIGIAIVNFIVRELYERRVYGHFGTLSHFNDMLGVAASLAGVQGSYDLPQLQTLRNKSERIDSLRSQIGWLLMDTSRLDMFTGFLVIYLNYFCLLDVIVAIRSLAPLNTHRRDCAEIFEAIASLDAAISVASWQAALPRTCIPCVCSDRLLEFDDVYHPLTRNPVANSISLHDESVLITGSNMSGKTTFIKTIGINVILGRTLNLCLARRCLIPEAIVKSSVAREESVDGQSYYFAEVKRLREFIELSSTEGTYLFLIDEIYRGTNTTERVAAASAVLAHLAERAIVLVTTHDIELQELLHRRYRMHHFREHVAVGRLRFDYVLRAGPASTRNAIKLLELSGYPASIIDDARATADRLEKPKKDGSH